MRKILHELHEEKRPEHEEQRVVTRFLFLPVILPNADGARELRWMERATILQQFNDILWVCQFGDCPGDPSSWKNIRWEKSENKNES